MYSFFLLHFTYYWRIKHRECECAFSEGLFYVGRGTWMFVRCIMKQHACIKFLSHLLSINYFMFVSFDILVVTPLTMAASVCTCLWRDVHYHGTQPIRERTCCVMGALFILFPWMSVYDISRAASVGPERELTTEALFFQACWYLTPPFHQHTYQSVIAFFHKWSK